MKLASMANMQLDPVPDEEPQSLSLGETTDASVALHPVQESEEVLAAEDATKEETFQGLDRFMRYLENQKKSQGRDPRYKRVLMTYRAQQNMELSVDFKGTKFNKAG